MDSVHIFKKRERVEALRPAPRVAIFKSDRFFPLASIPRVFRGFYVDGDGTLWAATTFSRSKVLRMQPAIFG